jgi:diguanylate cyclase (GGDEF)-like protein/PAS domain S-box-containing protein
MNKVQLAELIDKQVFGIAVFTADEGTYLYHNKAELILRELSAEQLCNASIFDFYDTSDAQQLKNLFQQCISSSTQQAHLFSFIKGNRTFQMSLVKSDNDTIISSLTDITSGQQLINQQLINEENIKRLSDAVAGANIGCWDFYPQEDRIVANETWVSQKKYKDKDFRFTNELFSEVINGMETWASIVHPDDLEATNILIEKHLNGETEFYDTHFRVKCGDDQWRWIHDMGRVFVRDKNGNAVRMNGVHIDVTELKQAEIREKARTHVLELMNAGKPLDVILKAIVKVVEQDNPNMLCSILLMDDTGKRLLLGAAPSLPEFYNDAINGVEIGKNVGSCGTAAHSNQRVIVSDIQVHPFWNDYRELANQAGLKSCWSEPIRSTSGKVLGTFAIYHRKINSPTENDLAIIEQTASLASIAIEKKQAEEKLFRAASVFTDAHEGIMITDANGLITEVNDTFSSITGFAAQEVMGEHPSILRSERQSSQANAEILTALTAKSHWHGETWSRRKNGEDYPLMLTVSAVKDAGDQVQHYVSLFTDITSIKAYQGQLERMAHYDALTDLPNRVLLADRLSQSMLQCKRRNKALAVAFMDLDGFKAVNDLHGHDMGDELLVALSQRMQGALREGDTLSRIGGDEFIAILTDLDSFEDCEPVLQRLLKATAEPMNVGNEVMQISVSIGVTLYPQDSVDADQLMRHADQAMYVAKQAGKNRYQLFDIALDHIRKTQGQGIGDIRLALNSEQFVLHYQPKVNMRTGDVVGVEALIRWQHPERGLVPPLEFLPLIEEDPISVELGEWVIGTALRQITRWQKTGINLPVSVNISAYQLQQDTFTARLAELLAAHPTVPPNYLELEILETSALQDTQQVSGVMDDCRELNVGFALDDFGTGYSSLNYLKRLPAYLIKIDQTFVRDMLEDSDDLAIIEGVIGLAKAFRRDVIAEGVETNAHGALLLKMGCDLAQGYGIARPMPSDDIPKWIKNWDINDFWQV